MKKTIMAMVRLDSRLAERVQTYACKQDIAFSTAIRSLAKKGIDEEEEEKRREKDK